jgi:hypothetical protein
MRFMTCHVCFIAEEYPDGQEECGHCGAEKLAPATRREVAANLPFMRQRADRSAEERATYNRAFGYAHLGVQDGGYRR